MASGVRNLPVILAVIFSSIFSGTFVTKKGLAIPVLVAGTVAAVVGCGLIYTLDIGTSAGEWIGYQIIVGVGYGSSF